MPFGKRAYVDPLAQQPVEPPPFRNVPSDPIKEQIPEESEFRPQTTSGRGLRYRPGNALIMGGTPVGAAGVKQYHAFDRRAVFNMDYEAKPVPPPNVTQAVRRSIFQPLQAIEYRFHINPAWGRNGGRYERFSFINLIASTGNQEQQLNKAQGDSANPKGKGRLFGEMGIRARQKFTKVLSYPRNETTPQTYSSDNGYGQ
jgi:hypothetical protein